MKILHVITSLHIGGAEKLMLDMLPLMKRAGHQVELLVFNGSVTPFYEQLLEKNVIIHAFGKKSVYHPFHIWKLRKIIKEFDIIHTHNTSPQFFAALAKMCIKSQTKLVTTEHSTNNRRRGIPGFRYLDRWMYEQYDRIIAISDKARECMHNYIECDLPLETVENGINLNVYHQEGVRHREQLGLPIDKTLCIQVAGFRLEKDQDTLIRALALLPDDYHVVLVGDGERRSLCETLAQELNLLGRVHFLGVRMDVPDLLKSSDVIVMSSHYEGLSLSSLEGMSVNKPFIASDVPGLREVVYGAGLLFAHEDSQELADLITKVCSDRDYYKQISSRCKERAKCFDIQKTVDAYLSIYHELYTNGQ